MRIMGLDISTTTVGIAVVDFTDAHIQVIHVDYYKPKKGELEDKAMDFLITLSEAKKTIHGIIKDYKPDVIAVEDYIRFMQGGSGAATIIPLATLNRTLCLLVKEEFPKKKLQLCNVMSIRTQIKKDLGMKELPPKETIPEALEKLMSIEIPRPLKGKPGKEKVMMEHYDMADAIAVAYYAHRKNQTK